MVETLIERLRNADTNSQQRVLGSRIFGEAADLLEALEREKEELRKERDRCHARLEIDHCFKLGDDDNLIRHEIPLNERSSFPDGITARDETIKLVERRAETAERQLAEAQGWAKEWHRTCETIATLMDLPEPEGATFAQAVSDKLAERDADLARVRGERAKQIAYSCDLQRIIEGLCGGGEIREPETTARYHYDMAVASRTALAGSGDAASKQYDTHQNGEDRALRSDIASPSTAGER